MDFDFPAADHPTRVELRAWIAENPSPTPQELQTAGLVVPHWPEPWGRNADPIDQIIIDEELSAAAIARPSNAIGIGWAAPTILVAGSEEMKAEFLPKIFTAEHVYCQLFSEPDSGSDLANLSTRAVRDGDEYVVNGSKIWSSGAHRSQMGILIARTDPDVSKHRGISYFLLPMDTPGVTMQPVIDMTTAHSFNQVFFDDVRIPASLRVGEEGDGWRLAKVTLANERVSLSSTGTMWGSGPSPELLFDLLRQDGGVSEPVLRDRAAALWSECEVLRLNRLRTLSARLSGRTPGPEASIQKIMGDELGQKVMEFVADRAGSASMLSGAGVAGAVPPAMQTGPTEIEQSDHPSAFDAVDPVWHYGLLFSPALTLGGGTFAIQRNIIAEQVLGLPRDINVESGKSWAECHGSAQQTPS